MMSILLFFSLGSFEVIVFLFAAIFGLVLPIMAFIDILKSEFKGNNKLMWALIVVFFNVFGSILYFLLGRDQKIQ